MDSITLHGKRFVPFITNSELEADIDAVAARIRADFEGSGEIPLLVCILNGSILFTAELMKRLEFPMEIATLRVSSYEGTSSTGSFNRVLGLTADIKGRTVIVVEDIVDTGNTLAMLLEHLAEQGPKRILTCTLLRKPEVFKGRFHIDYVGRDIPNKFVLGFGLDYDQLGRNLKDLYVLDE